MRGIRFVYSPPVSAPVLSRMDVACFIGYTPLRKPDVVPDAIERWWDRQGWLRSKEIGGQAEAVAAGLPIPIESWEAFESVFRGTRVDRSGAVQSDPLPPTLTVSGDERHLDVLVDGNPVRLTLLQTPGPIKLARVVEQINARIEQINQRDDVRIGLVASIADGGNALLLKRTDEVAAGELTVYSNEALGFPHARQQDVVLMDNYLSVAVREFFEHGGRKCYVIRLGDPVPVAASEARKVTGLLSLVWGDGFAKTVSRSGTLTLEDLLSLDLPALNSDSGGLKQPNGLSYLTTLPEVTYVSLPDLIDLVGHHEVEVPEAPEESPPEVFVTCSDGEASDPWFYSHAFAAPVCDRIAYEVWSRVVTTVLTFLEDHAPLVQLVASLPMPASAMRRDFERFITSEVLPGDRGVDDDPAEDPLKRLQLTFPWLKSDRSEGLPGSALPPEGPLVGVLANGAITRGAYRSLAGTRMTSVYDVLPRDVNPFEASSENELAPADRISWFEFVPSGIELSTDVTATSNPTNRYAVVRRIMVLVQRAAYEIGLSHVFDTNSDRTWRAVERKLRDVLAVIYQKNGLRGRSPADAFSVTCDRSTMSQSDIDNGRLIASITLRPAVPVEQIVIDLLLENGGRPVLRNAV